MKKNASPVVSLVSLGCSKNTVDSERILGGLIADGWLLAENPADADVCLVNTCGFIESAREETRQTVETLAKGRRRGRPQWIVALGCMVERAASAPETGSVLAAADLRIGFADYARLPRLCRALLAGAEPPRDPPAHAGSVPPEAFYDLPRLLTGMPHCAYLKISEGCSNRCSFCSIPLIRGSQVSRPATEIVREARDLAESGAREIGLIAQDTTSYGRDRPGDARLTDLLRRVAAALDSAIWIRLMYAHPRRLTGEMLRTLRELPALCPYLDLPLQHISDPLLRAMGRGMTRAQTLRRLDHIRKLWPEAALRTTFIVGYPEETDEDFESLMDLVREERFAHVGVFTYSPEPGTRAARLAGTVSPEVARDRRDRLMRAQQVVSRRRLKAWRGRDLPAMLDAPESAGTWIARARWQAPEVDGVIRVQVGAKRARPGDVRSVHITQTGDYDLRGVSGSVGLV